jgi:hypothetical protein
LQARRGSSRCGKAGLGLHARLRRAGATAPGYCVTRLSPLPPSTTSVPAPPLRVSLPSSP